jgi:hypothetical protein
MKIVEKIRAVQYFPRNESAINAPTRGVRKLVPCQAETSLAAATFVSCRTFVR